MSAMRLYVTIASIGALFLSGGCDFHDDPPPLEGDYQSTRFMVSTGQGTVDLLTAGARVDMTFRDDGRFSAHVLIPAGSVVQDQGRIDSTLSGAYSRIVNKVTLDFDGETMGFPAAWRYRHGRLYAEGSVIRIAGVPVAVEIELVRL